MQVRSCETLVIFIKTTGESKVLVNCFYISLSFTFHFIRKKKKVAAGIFFLFGVVLGCPVLAAGEHVPVD